MKIPPIIHQKWNDEHVPKVFQMLSQTWREMLPDWEYHLWTDETTREFVRTNFPDFLMRYDAYPKDIQRTDAVRYLILKTHGGLYVDMDFECLKPEFVTLLGNASFVIGKEPHSHAKKQGKEYILCNALMASTPNHPFLDAVCQRMMTHPHGWHVRHAGDILDSTGPFLLTDAYKDFHDKGSVRIIEPEYLYPIKIGETKNIIDNNIPDDMQQRINEAYAIHYFAGSWHNK